MWSIQAECVLTVWSIWAECVLTVWSIWAECVLIVWSIWAECVLTCVIYMSRKWADWCGIMLAWDEQWAQEEWHQQKGFQYSPRNWLPLLDAVSVTIVRDTQQHSKEGSIPQFWYSTPLATFLLGFFFQSVWSEFRMVHLVPFSIASNLFPRNFLWHFHLSSESISDWYLPSSCCHGNSTCCSLFLNPLGCLAFWDELLFHRSSLFAFLFQFALQ